MSDTNAAPESAAPANDAQPALAVRVQQLFALRAKIKEVKDAQKAALAPFLEAEEKLEAVLTAALQQSGGTSFAVRGTGTIYLGTETSATVADGDEFKRHVIGEQAWGLVDWRANKTGVKEFIQAHGGAVPPGVNYTSRIRLGVRSDNTPT